MLKQLNITLLLVALVAPSVWGQDTPDWLKRTRISGLAFGDAYWMPTNGNSELKADNGFWLRRTYLTVDHTLNDEFTFRIRFEANSPGDFTSAAKLEPFIKDLYMKWTGGDHQVYLGIAGTPIWGTVEKVWGYRSVEKTPLDLQKLGSSRDFGVAVKGRFDRDGKLRYHAQVGNGSGTKGEADAGKKVGASLGLYPVKGFLVEVYGDYEGKPGRNDRSVMQLFTAYQSDRGRIGLQVARQHRQVEGSRSLDLDLASFFGALSLNSHVAVFARYDRMFDPNPDAAKVAYLPLDPTAKSNLLLVGLDLTLADEFHLIPNVEAVFYDRAQQATTPGSDVMLRTTFFVTF